MSLLPSSPDVQPDGEPRVVGLDSEEADDLMAALSSTTARRLLAELHEEPAPPGELADRADTSLQNAQYHLEKLEDAGAVEVVGTAYSEKGREMSVYGPADSPLVIFAGEKERASGLRAAVSRLFAGFAGLAVGALAIQEAFGESILNLARDDAAPAPGGGDGGDGGDAADATPAETSTPTETPMPAPEETEDAAVAEATPTPAPEATSTPAPDGATPAAEEETPVPEYDMGDGGAEPMVAEETPTPTEVPTETPVPDVDAPGLLEGLLATGLPPGVAFFLGGATVLTVLVAVSYYRAHP